MLWKLKQFLISQSLISFQLVSYNLGFSTFLPQMVQEVTQKKYLFPH